LYLYDDAHELKEEMEDMHSWLTGLYVHEAVSVIVSNFASKKGAKPKEYRNKPLMADYRESHRELSEEEKQAQIAILFGNLDAMQRAFEQTHGE